MSTSGVHVSYDIGIMCTYSFRIVPSFVFNVVLFLGQLQSKVTYRSTMLSVLLVAWKHLIGSLCLDLWDIKWTKDEIIDIYSMKQ